MARDCDAPAHGPALRCVRASDALREKEARLQYLKGRLNAQQSELEAMARLLAYLRGTVSAADHRGGDTSAAPAARPSARPSQSRFPVVLPAPGVHIADVPERGNDEDLRNALIASLMGDSEDEQALSDLQALTNGQLLDKVRGASEMGGDAQRSQSSALTTLLPRAHTFFSLMTQARAQGQEHLRDEM